MDKRMTIATHTTKIGGRKTLSGGSAASPSRKRRCRGSTEGVDAASPAAKSGPALNSQSGLRCSLAPRHRHPALLLLSR
jgi:hypothetical protein